MTVWTRTATRLAVATRCDTDDDNDSILDGADSAPAGRRRSARTWMATACDDCSVVQPPDTANDGLDTDSDGTLRCKRCTDDDGDGYGG